MLDIGVTANTLAEALVAHYDETAEGGEAHARLAPELAERVPVDLLPTFTAPPLLLGTDLLLSIYMTGQFYLVNAFEWHAEEQQLGERLGVETIDCYRESASLPELVTRLAHYFVPRVRAILLQRVARRKHVAQVVSVADRLSALLPEGENHCETDPNEASVALWSRPAQFMFTGISVRVGVNWSPLNTSAGVAVDVTLCGLDEREAACVLALYSALRAGRGLAATAESAEAHDA